MANKEKTDSLLQDIRKLEKEITAMQEAEIYPVSFFNQSFGLAHKILTGLYELEVGQLELLNRLKEEHRKQLQATPLQQAVPQPAVPPVSPPVQEKNLPDIRKAFSLNDRFRFRRELFGGNEGQMNKVMTKLNGIRSYEEAIAYLRDELEWNMEDEVVVDFVAFLEKRV
jgi:hypothetical protein